MDNCIFSCSLRDPLRVSEFLFTLHRRWPPNKCYCARSAHNVCVYMCSKMYALSAPLSPDGASVVRWDSSIRHLDLSKALHDYVHDDSWPKYRDTLSDLIVNGWNHINAREVSAETHSKRLICVASLISVTYQTFHDFQCLPLDTFWPSLPIKNFTTVISSKTSELTKSSQWSFILKVFRSWSCLLYTFPLNRKLFRCCPTPPPFQTLDICKKICLPGS